MGSRFRPPSVRVLGSALLLPWVVFSCSLRDTSSLDSGGAAAGSPSSAGSDSNSAGNAGSPSAGRAGTEEPLAGSGGMNVVAGSDSTAGSSESGAGEAGAMELGGSGGMPNVGAFSNCPGRFLWAVDSNPSAAEVQAVGSQLMIAQNQMLPQYAIDDADTTGTATRYSTGRVTVGDEYISVDMGAERWVTGVYTKEASSDYGRSYEVSVSRDGLSFIAVATQEGMVGAFDIPFAPVIARFVRLSQKGTTETEWWSLHDYKVYCTADPVPQGGAGGGGGTSGGAGKGGNGQ